jgi:hypothetical protein
MIIFSDHMQLVKYLFGKLHQWYKYSPLNLKQIGTVGYLLIFSLAYWPTIGRNITCYK